MGSCNCLITEIIKCRITYFAPKPLGRLTIILEDDLEKRLREYIARNYAEETYGKISQIINESLRRFLDIYMQAET